MNNPMKSNELGLLIGRCLHSAYEQDSTKTYFFNPVNLLEMVLFEVEYDAVKEYRLKDFVKLANEYVPAFIKRNIFISEEVC